VVLLVFKEIKKIVKKISYKLNVVSLGLVGPKDDLFTGKKDPIFFPVFKRR